MPVRTQKIKNFGFCVQHAVTVSQKFQMALANVCDHACIRLCNLCQPVHFSEMADPHLQHCDLVLVPQPEDSQRKSEIIIKVSCRL